MTDKTNGTEGAFRKAAQAASFQVGRPWAFAGAVTLIVGWAILGPVFGFSDTWQLVINTGTTIITFLMVFLVQNTQNRDAKAIQLKLDELLRGVEGARNDLVALEGLSDEELERLEREFDRIRNRAASATSLKERALGNRATSSAESTGN
jgi:low affinity Fe/Cu permease